MTTTHGGKRPGAGRKADPASLAERITARCPAGTRALLAELAETREQRPGDVLRAALEGLSHDLPRLSHAGESGDA